jgi:uncharacterized protein (DUF1684 family)
MKYAIGVMLVGLCVGCARQRWPEPPAVDRAQYQKQYQSWLDEQQQTARESSTIVGIWPLDDGETPFGSDKSLPIVLPASASPPRAGVFRRAGENVKVAPASGVTLLGGDGEPLTGMSDVPWGMKLGSLSMSVIPLPGGRQFVTASDGAHSSLKDFPHVQTYAVDMRWRVAARFDAFAPRMMQIADVRGGTMDYPAVGRLTFRIGEQEPHGAWLSRQRRVVRDVQGPHQRGHDVRLPHAGREGCGERRMDRARLQRCEESAVRVLAVHDVPAPAAGESSCGRDRGR